MYRILKYLFLFVLVSASLQCGDSSTQDDVKVYLGPTTQPQVFLAPITVNTADGERSLTPPWISFQLKVDNLTGETLYILGISFVIKYTNKGVFETGKTEAFEPSNFRDSNNDPLTNFIAEIPADGSFEPEVIFYLDSLPNPEEDQADSFVYTIEGYIEGYTGTIFEPNRNIRKRFNFTTKQPIF